MPCCSALAPLSNSGEGDDMIATYDEVFESFDAMGLHENLLRGIYAYGEASVKLPPLPWSADCESSSRRSLPCRAFCGVFSAALLLSPAITRAVHHGKGIKSGAGWQVLPALLELQC